MSKKTYVIDSNVLIHDPRCIFKFDEHDIKIPIVVLEELDKLKKDSREVGRSARVVTRYIKELIDSNISSNNIMPINDKGGTIEIALNCPWTLIGLDETKPDHQILNTAKYLNAILVTNDSNLYAKAKPFNVPVQEYKNDRVSDDDTYTGMETIIVDTSYIDSIYAKGYIELNDELRSLFVDLYPNLNVIMKDSNKHSALCRYDAQHEILKVLPQDQKIMGLIPRNIEQRFAIDMLLDPNIKLVTLEGLAGSGKSLNSLMAGLYLVTEKQEYKKLLIFRPFVPMGNDLGYVPGSLDDKILPWMQPIVDNVDYILSASDKGESKKSKGKSSQFASSVSGADTLVNYGLLEYGALNFIRGRSIPDQFIIVDDAANLSLHEMKTLITRAGENTKIVLTFDPNQVDSPYLDSTNNGATIVANKFKYEKIHGHIKFTKSERSDLASVATRIL